MTTAFPRAIEQDISSHFAFLFDRGYVITGREYYPKHFGNWSVFLQSGECGIQITSDRSELMVLLCPLSTDRRVCIEIRAFLYCLSQGRDFVGAYQGNMTRGKKKQFEWLSELLRQNLDRALPHFGEEFDAHRESLLSAQKRYNEEALARYALK